MYKPLDTTHVLSTADRDHLDPAALQALQDIICERLAKRAQEHTAAMPGVGNGWYEMGLQHAAELVALEFKLARGE